MATEGSVDLGLSHSEALVLFELLTRIGSHPPDGLFEDAAEQRVLDDMLCALEEKLADPFAPDYRERLERARQEVLNPPSGK
jgi:hypothetical protein